MVTILRTVAELVRQQGMFSPGDRVVVGVSGGADSVALLRILSLLPGLDLSLVVAHVNHGIRGAAADRDEQFVRQLAGSMGLPCEVERLDVVAIARQRSLSLEEAGREVRYAFFRRVRVSHDARRIAVAHTADDQAETVLMRLLRGAGPAGAAGMETLTPDGIARPLLTSRRGEIIALLRSLDQGWCEDESNEDQAFLRNRVRHGVLPVLEEINPRVRQALCQFARLAADDEAYLAGLSTAEFNRLAVVEPDQVRLQTAPLLQLQRSLRYRVIRRALQEVRGDLRRLSYHHVEAVDNLMASSRPNATLNLPGAVAMRAYGVLTIAVELPAAWDGEVPVTGAGEYLLPDGSLLVVTEGRVPELSPDDRHVIMVDAAVAPLPWTVRSVRPGDALFLTGVGGHKRLKKLFMEEQVPREERRRLPLLVCGTDVLWVCGVRRSDRARPCAGGGRAVHLLYKKNHREGLQLD